MSNSWLRLWHEMPNDPKWRVISRASNQPIPSVISVYVHMLVCASNATERGRTQGWSDEDCAAALDLQTAEVAGIRDAMQGRVIDGDALKGWSKRQPQREDNSADRAREWRDKKDAERNRTQPNADEPKIRGDKKRKEEEIPASASDEKTPKSNPVEDWFESEFWPSWVKRERDDKGAALNHAKKVAKTEGLRSQILAASKSQRGERMGQDPEFRKGASGWLRDGGWKHGAEPAQPSLPIHPQGPAYQPWVDPFAHLKRVPHE